MPDDVLEKLRDVHISKEPSFWPPAIGYWVVLLIFLLFLIGIVWVFIVKIKPKIKLKKYLLREIDDHHRKSDIASLLRRLVAKVYNDPQLKNKDLKDLILKLNKIFKRDKNKFNQLMDMLGEDRFKPSHNNSDEEVINLTKELVRKCKL